MGILLFIKNLIFVEFSKIRTIGVAVIFFIVKYWTENDFLRRDGQPEGFTTIQYP